MLKGMMKTMSMLMLQKIRWRLTMLRMMRSSRKMMMLRLVVLRRRKKMIIGEEDGPQDWDPHFVPACAVDMHVDISQEPLYARFTGKMPQTKTADHTLCEPAQSKCTWTFHKSH